jgi:Uma2 family endonuclease
MLGYEDLLFSAEAEQTMGMPIATERYWTVDDVWALPDDPHHRYEAVDGELLVSPSPRFLHQRAVGELYVELRAYCRRVGICEAVMAPSDVVVEDVNLVQPDLYTIRTLTPRELVSGARGLPLPLLTVEVLSPSTARADRLVKRRLFQRNAVEYWVVDLDARVIERWLPDAAEPEICAERISWRAPGASSAMSMDITALMGRIWGDLA